MFPLRRLAVAALAGALAVAPAIPHAWASPQGKRLALLTTPNAQAYMGAWAATFLKAAPALGMEATQRTTPFDAAVQSQQVDDAIAQKFDAILINTVDPQAIQPALARAKAAGIPVFLIVNPGAPGAEPLYTSFIGVNQTELGRLAGENMVKAMQQLGKANAQVVAVTGTASQLNARNRMDGFKTALATAPGIKLVAEEDARWNTANSEKITSDLLVRFNAKGGVDGVYAMADNMAGAAIEAIQQAGLPVGTGEKGIVVVSSNCMKEGIQHIKDGTQFATNTQIPVEEARIAAQKIADYFDGKTLEKNEYVPISVITRANVDQFAGPCSY